MSARPLVTPAARPAGDDRRIGENRTMDGEFVLRWPMLLYSWVPHGREPEGASQSAQIARTLVG